MHSTGNQNGFSFPNSPLAEGKTTFLVEPPIGFEPMTCRLRIGCTANCATVAHFVAAGIIKES
jgi:hypothetical protein